PGHHRFGAEVDDLDDVDELVQLLLDLLQRPRIAGGHDDHAGQPGFLARSDGDAVDVEAAPAEQAGHPLQDAGLVVHEHRQRVFLFHHASSPKIMSLIVFPWVTIGYTFSSLDTTKSMSTGPGCSSASFQARRASSLFVARRPLMP